MVFDSMEILDLVRIRIQVEQNRLRYGSIARFKKLTFHFVKKIYLSVDVGMHFFKDLGSIRLIVLKNQKKHSYSTITKL